MPGQQIIKDEPAPADATAFFNPCIWLEGGMAVLNRSGGILEINQALSTWLEKPVTDFIGESFWDTLSRISPEWAAPLAGFAHGTAPFGSLVLSLPACGNQGPQWFKMEIARVPQYSFVRFNSTLPPLSDLKEGAAGAAPAPESVQRDRFGRMLREGARLEGLTKGWPCVILSQRPDFTLEFTSPNIQELTGLDPVAWYDEVGHFWELVHESDAAELRQQFKRAVQRNAPVASTYRIRHAQTGRVAYILEYRQPVLTPQGLLLGYEVAWLDVTRQTIAERRLSAAAWKETLAVLTLGMAHDFTNVIAGIHSLSESFLAQVDEKHVFHEGLSLIKKSSLQASQLVQRMISLHLGQPGERTYQNLNEFANDMMELAKKTLPRRVKVVAELCKAQLPVYVDVVEFRRAVINLILNAADAMPSGGTLTLRASRHDTAPVLHNMKGVTPRLPCVCLTIKDTGLGIKQRHLASIFDPFFTTKAKGSGLGLYNVRLTIEKMQGAISVASIEGTGASFQIWLPEADFSESNRLEETAQNNRAARHSLLILGSAGEVLDKTAELLRSHNYYVVTAGLSDSLSELLQSSDYQFHGVMIIAEPNDASLNSLPAEVRQQNKNLKLALKLSGCNEDELDAQLLEGTDLVLSADLPESDFLSKLSSFFDHAG